MITPLVTDNSTQIGKENFIIQILPHALLYTMKKRIRIQFLCFTGLLNRIRSERGTALTHSFQIEILF